MNKYCRSRKSARRTIQRVAGNFSRSEEDMVSKMTWLMRGELNDLGEGKWPGNVIGIIIIMSFKCNAGVLKLIKE